MAPLLLAPAEGWVALQALLGSFFPLLVHFHLELHRNTDKVGSVITSSIAVADLLLQESYQEEDEECMLDFQSQTVTAVTYIVHGSH